MSKITLLLHDCTGKATSNQPGHLAVGLAGPPLVLQVGGEENQTAHLATEARRPREVSELTSPTQSQSERGSQPWTVKYKIWKSALQMVEQISLRRKFWPCFERPLSSVHVFNFLGAQSDLGPSSTLLRSTLQMQYWFLEEINPSLKQDLPSNPHFSAQNHSSTWIKITDHGAEFLSAWSVLQSSDHVCMALDLRGQGPAMPTPYLQHMETTFGCVKLQLEVKEQFLVCKLWLQYIVVLLEF